MQWKKIAVENLTALQIRIALPFSTYQGFHS